MNASIHACQACAGVDLGEIADFATLPRVTSDSKPYASGGRLFVCGSCGLVQKIADAQWLRETAEIYRDYEMYHQSAADDQAVFDPVSGRPSGRCEVLARRLNESGAIAPSGALLDVGAGSGAMLAAFSKTSDRWRLFGLDLDDRKEAALRAIPRFETLYTTPPEALDERFDLITLIHSLEHFPVPRQMLRILADRIAPGSALFVQVNDAARTPFDLVVADHLCHFTPRSLAYLVGSAGYAVRLSRSDWVNKEISLLASPASGTTGTDPDDPRTSAERTRCDVAWLAAMLEHARVMAGNGRFGIFGTSVAATWLAAGLGDAVEFFVDEDPAREGRSHLGKPILRPDAIPGGGVAYLAFVPQIARSIHDRLEQHAAAFALPPDMPTALPTH